MRSLWQRVCGVVAVAVVVLGGAGAVDCRGAITNFDLFTTNFHRQTSASPPGAAYAYTFSARIMNNNPSDFTGAQVTQQGPVSPMVLTNHGGEWAYFSGPYQSRDLRDGSYLAGAYVFSVTGGTMGGQSATRQFPGHTRFTTSVPYFSQYNELQNLDSSVDNTITPNFFQVPATVDFGYTFLLIYDAGGTLVSASSSPANAGSFLIPGHLLQPSSNYTISMYFSGRVHANNAGFAGAFSQIAWDVVTDAPLRTRPASNCGTADFDGDGDFATDADIEAFWLCIAGNCCGACFGPDFNQDGDASTDADIEAFYRVLAGQAC